MLFGHGWSVGKALGRVELDFRDERGERDSSASLARELGSIEGCERTGISGGRWSGSDSPARHGGGCRLIGIGPRREIASPGLARVGLGCEDWTP